MKNMMERYNCYMLLGVLCTLSSFFYTQAGDVCTRYAVVESLVPAGTMMAGVGLGGLGHIPLWKTVLTGVAGVLLVKARMEFSNNNRVIIGTKVVQAMIPVCWGLYWWQQEKNDPGKENLKWFALGAACMEIGIHACY